MNNILKRRSIRKYKNKKVEEEKIESLILAGMAAPSAYGNNPWHFFVVKNREILDGITKVHPHAEMLKEADFGIVVCFESEKEKSKDWMQQDLAAATENILIAAQSMDLGAVWLGVYPREDRVEGIQRLLGIEDNEYIPFCVIPVGYPDEKKEPRAEFDNSKVSFVD